MKKTFSYFLHVLFIITSVFLILFTYKNNNLGNLKVENLPKVIVFILASHLLAIASVTSLVFEIMDKDNSIFIDGCIIAVIAVPFANFASSLIVSIIKGLDYEPYLFSTIFTTLAIGAMIAGFIFNRKDTNDVLTFILFLVGTVIFTLGTFISIEDVGGTAIFLAVGDVFGAMTCVLYSVMLGLKLKGTLD